MQTAELMTVFVDERPVAVARGSTARDAVAAFDPDIASKLDDGLAYLTDGVGSKIDADVSLSAGSIIRIVRSASRREEKGRSAE